jgi:Flp pilus assembly protein TadD
MAETEVKLMSSGRWVVNGTETAKRTPNSELRTPDSKRWNDYGIALWEQAQYGEAAAAFRRASELSPRDANLLVNAAIAELRTERFGPEREQLRKAASLLDAALGIDPAHRRARFFRAVVLRGEGRAAAAADELTELAREYPRDREVQRQLGQTLYALGALAGARQAFEAVTAIDPTDAGAYQFLAPIYAGAGHGAEAERARSLYLGWRDDPGADGVAARFFAAHPQWAEERMGGHAHGENSPRRRSRPGELPPSAQGYSAPPAPPAPPTAH